MELDFLEKLLQEPQTERREVVARPRTHNVPKYHLSEGPLVVLEEIVKCERMLADNECPNMTYYSLLDIPTCLLHALREMNTMLSELGV